MQGNDVSLTWDALKPSESSDQEYWEVKYKSTNSSTISNITIAKDETGIIIPASKFTVGEEYTFTLKFVGFDNLKSEVGVIDTLTII